MSGHCICRARGTYLWLEYFALHLPNLLVHAEHGLPVQKPDRQDFTALDVIPQQPSIEIIHSDISIMVPLVIHVIPEARPLQVRLLKGRRAIVEVRVGRDQRRGTVLLVDDLRDAYTWVSDGAAFRGIRYTSATYCLSHLLGAAHGRDKGEEACCLFVTS